MNIKKLITIAALVFAGATFAADKADESKEPPATIMPKKIALLICDVGTLDQVAKTEEYLTQIKQNHLADMPKIPDGYSTVNPRATEININMEMSEKWRAYREAVAEVRRRNQKMEKIFDGLRNNVLVNDREMITAKTQMQAAIFDIGANEYFELIDRGNSDLAQIEQAIGEKDTVDIASATYFLTIIAKDQKKESREIQVQGAKAQVKRTKFTRTYVGNVRDFSGTVKYAFTINVSADQTQGSAVKAEIPEPTEELLQKALAEIAKKLRDNLTTELTFKFKGPKNISFDADDVTVYINGEEFNNGDRVILYGGNITVEAEHDGCADIKKVVGLKEKTKQSLTLKFKAEKTEEKDAE